jgi:quinol monooxygenase YgiN
MEVEAVSELLGIARFTFHEGKVDDFKRLSEQCMEIVRTKDNGTLHYDIYFNRRRVRSHRHREVPRF